MNSVRMPPMVSVTVGGRPLPTTWTRAMADLVVNQRLSLPSVCEMRFLDSAGELGSGLDFPPGTRIRVELPDQGVLFEGETTAVSLAYRADRVREIRVRAYDLLHRLRKRLSVRAHVEITAEDLARELTAGLGVSVVASESGPMRRRIVQYRHSDLSLLQEVAGLSGLHFFLKGAELNLMTLEGAGPSIGLTLGKSLLEASVTLNSDVACRSVLTMGWDPSRVKAHEGRATAPRSGRSITAATTPADVGGLDELILADLAVDDPAEADAVSRSHLDAREARTVTLSGVAEGDPALVPGAIVEVSGLDTSFTGTYVLTSVEHTIRPEEGYVSAFSTDPPRPASIDRNAIATWATVSRVDDPEDLGRVKVSLPVHGNVETDWLSVVLPGAGRDKGVLVLPDVGDQVLMLSIQGDPARGVVLGCIYGTQGVPEKVVEGGAIRSWAVRTPGGHRVLLDDGERRLEVRSHNGSLLDLRPDSLTLHAETDLLIEAPGRSITIRAESIDFERA